MRRTTRFSDEDVARLLDVVGSASLGGSFPVRMGAISESLARVIPHGGLVSQIIDESVAPMNSERRGAGPWLALPPARCAVATNYDPRLVEEYAQYYVRFDAITGQAVRSPGVVLGAREFYGSTWGKDPFTGEFMPKTGFADGICYLQKLPQGLAMSMLLVRPRGAAPFTQVERRALDLVRPHLARAAFGIIVMDQLARASRSPGGHPEAGVLLFQADGALIHSDPAARALLALVETEGHLASDMLISIVRELAAARADDVAGPRERFLPLAEGGWLRAGFSRIGGPGGSVAVILHAVPIGSPQSFEVEATRARLTPREREVTALAIRGLGNREIGRAIHAAAETVKRHLGHIFKKVGVSSRTELAARMYAGAEQRES